MTPLQVQAFAASYAQSRLWFLQQLEPGLTAYHMPMQWRLRGALDVKALEAALAGLMERHATLRTSFRLHGGEVLQLIHPLGEFGLAVEELGQRDGEEVIRTWLEEERRTPFDLTSGVLLRARLLQVTPQEHVLLVNHHHIASDGWSHSVLVRDLTELYNAHSNGRSADLQPLAVHYHDYAAWQRQRLSGDRLQTLKDYWIPQLTALEPLELPSDHPRPATPSHQGASVSFQITPELLAPFEDLCRLEGATLQMGLLALLALLLHRYSRQDDFAIGIPIWSRNHPDLEPLIGFFINTLPIRTRLEPQQSFRQLLQQVKASSLAAYDHQELPFEQMVQALNLPRDTSRNPLVQVILQLIELPEASLHGLESLEVEPLISQPPAARFDLEFYLRRTQHDGLSSTVVYATDLFDGERIERISSHLITLLASTLQAPDAPTDSLCLLPDAERLLIESWQQGPTIELPDLCVHQLFEQQVESTPDAIALIFEDQQLTYQQLNTRANQLAHHLIDLGVGPEVIVAVCLERSLEMVVALLAILKAGGAYVPLDPSYPEERLAFMLQDSAPMVLLIQAATRDLFSAPKDLVPRVDLDADAQLWVALADTNPDPAALGLKSCHLAYLLYTSGSTGKPKGVMVEHRSIVNFIAWAQREFPGETLRHTLFATSINFDLAVYECFVPIVVGGTSVIVRNVMNTGAALTEVSLINTVPSALNTLLQAGTLPPSVREVNLAGEPLSRELADAVFGGSQVEHVRNLYGPTETTIYSTWVTLRRDEGFAPHIGRPITNTRIYLLNDQGQPVPIGITGEIHIGGAGVARGYLNRPELTAHRFLPDPFTAESGARMYKTGDLARWLPDGNLEFLGRADFQVKLRGFRIELGEIEAALRACGGIRDAVVLAREDAPGDQRLVAYLTGTPGGPDDLRRQLGAALPQHMVPAAFVVLDTFPLTPNGKLDRKALPAPSFSGDQDQRVAPSTDLERQLHAIWAEVLGHADFGISDNFFVIGGHSLAAVRLISRLDQTIGNAPSVAAFFQHPTIAALEPLLAPTNNNHQIHQLRAIAQADPIPGDWPHGCLAYNASFPQARLWFLHQLKPELTAYHLPALWRLRGDLDLQALAQALSDLIARHPTLRTSFRLQGSEVLQIIHPPAPLPLEAERLGDRHPDAVIQQWLEHEQTTPFDLSSGLLLRARLLAVDHQHHLLLLNHHHIASDGWSHSLLASDLTALYNAHHSGRSPDLQPLAVHYQDYAAWQRQRLSDDRLQTLKDYWIHQLTGLEPLELPTDHPRPATPSHKGDSVYFQIGPELLAPFEALCRSEGATLQMGLLALLALLLHRYSRQEDFAIGVPIWGRSHPDLEPLIGFFINTLPIRTRLEPQQSFRQLLQQVKASSLAAYDHQELPFEQIVEALNLPRDTSRNPLVQVILQLIELPEASLHGLEALEVELLISQPPAARFDLEFHLRRIQHGGLSGSVVYASDLFDRSRIERIGTHLLTLLASTLQAPDAPTDSLCLLPDAERLLIESWQQGPTIELPDLCVHQLFEQQVESTPDAIALIFEDQQLTYQQLNRRANQLAHHLIDLGVGPEVIVAVCLERSVELIVSLLAILKSGGTYLPLDPTWPQERRAQLINQSSCHVLIDATGPAPLDPPRRPPPTTHGQPIAYIAYTSGSTGIPKGVVVPHRAILRLVDPVNGFRLAPGSRVLQLAPVAFDAATFEIWGPLLNGGSLVVAPPGQPTLADLASLLHTQRITTLWLTAGLFHAMVDNEPSRLAEVQQILAGGEVLSAEHVLRLLGILPAGHALINGYGPTENTTFTCCHRITAGERLAGDDVAIGRPIAGSTVRVLDTYGQPCPIGIPGELHIGGAGLASGYLNQPERTAEAFIPDPFSSIPTARLYRSGDLASWNPDGTLAFHGRMDQQIKLRGFRIEPGEIEANLLTYTGVAQAVVVLRREDLLNPRLIAYWVADPADPRAGSVTSEQLRSFLAERIPAPMVPAVFMQLEALPLTSNGKVDRRVLPAPSFSGDQDQRVEPSTDLERQLHAIWAEVLGHADFGISDNFFVIGGHSLAAARLAAAVQRGLGLNLTVATIFLLPTIAEQAGRLSRGEPRTTGHLVTLQPAGDRPPLYGIHGGDGKVGGFIELARALAPHRPMLALQGEESYGTDGLPADLTLESLAARYADQILASHPGGPIHLIGFSAGGWYAHAVAAALLQRGASIGMVAVLDTHASARIHRRIGLQRMGRTLLRRLPHHLPQLIRPPAHQRRRHYVVERLQALHHHLNSHLGLRWRRPRSGFARPGDTPKPEAAATREDPFLALHRSYRPPRLPLVVDLFVPASRLALLNELWSFYGRQGVRLHPLFDDHMDFIHPENMAALARALEDALEIVEHGQ